MGMIGIAVGPVLVGLAVLFLARRPGMGGRSGGLVLALTPLALLSITIPLFSATRQFINGFQELANQGRGGTAAVAPLCLAIARPLLFGTIASLASTLAAAAFQFSYRRTGLPLDSAEREKTSIWYVRLILVAGSGLVVPVGVLVFMGQQMASLTMLVVDPAKKEEATVALAGMDLQRVSGLIAGASAAVLRDSLALSVVLLVFGIVGILVWRLNGDRHFLWGYSWLFLLVVTLPAAWEIFQLQSDVSWYYSAGRGSPPSEGSVSPSEKRVERQSTPSDHPAGGSSNAGGPAYPGVGDVSNPKLVPASKVVPKYPEKAFRAKVEGKVILQCVVRKDGSVGDIEVLEAPQEGLGFEDAAISAVRQWQYEPGLKDGRPIDVYFTVIVEFHLTR